MCSIFACKLLKKKFPKLYYCILLLLHYALLQHFLASFFWNFKINKYISRVFHYKLTDLLESTSSYVLRENNRDSSTESHNQQNN